MAVQMKNGKPYGMRTADYATFLAAGNDPAHIMQTVKIGDGVAASGHTHDAVGVDEWGDPVSAAFDYHTAGNTPEQKTDFVERNGLHTIAAYQRETNKNGWSGVEHAHCLFAASLMNLDDRNQLHDYCNGRNGLVNHGPLGYPPSQEAVNAVREAYLNSGNPVMG